MSWTDERVELLKKLWGDGQSASKIAKELGGVTRNAVIGKVHRLGLSNRSTSNSKNETVPKGVKKTEKTVAKKTKTGLREKDTVSGTIPTRRQIIPAGQPLPPQPSANEISPEALARVSAIEKKAKKLTLLELTERTCKWPVGDPATPDFWFCGLPTQSGKPYCEAHVGVAFQPMNARRDRRR